MVPVLVLLTMAVFILVDLALRLFLKKREEAHLRHEREAALDIGLRLEYTDEAASLKRVEVQNPQARILAVDDEPVVLDSFRKILVLEGYSIDTVESAQEAIGLIRKRDYDFVYADLKMPVMDGIDLTKAVKHLRPDIDVVIITGYASVESAVETMKHGAVDYVQKPFTAEELADFTRKILIRRQDRLAQVMPPKVHLIEPGASASDSSRVINVPGGIFVSTEHTWAALDLNGEARIGLDDLAQKMLPDIDDIDFPENGQRVRRGEPLFSVRSRDRRLTFSAPAGGRVSSVNHELTYHLDVLARRPFATSWICCLVPDRLTEDLARLKVGADSVSWYKTEIDRLQIALAELHPEAELDREARWTAFATCFLPAKKLGDAGRTALATAVLLLATFSIGSAPAETLDATEVVEVIEWPSATGTVSFPHRYHAVDLDTPCADCHHETDAARLQLPHPGYFEDFWIRCESCHHETSERANPQTCSTCHHDSPVTIADETLSSKVVIHQRCWACHEVATGAEASQSCGSCHQEDEGGSPPEGAGP